MTWLIKPQTNTLVQLVVYIVLTPHHAALIALRNTIQDHVVIAVSAGQVEQPTLVITYINKEE